MALVFELKASTSMLGDERTAGVLAVVVMDSLAEDRWWWLLVVVTPLVMVEARRMGS